MSVNTEVYKKVKQELDVRQVQLVAVSKYQSIDDIKRLYDLGQRDFGENYVQELIEKYESLPKDISWHFIGHLQSNKVKYISPFIHLIQGVDSEKLLAEINKQGAKINRKIGCLLQVHIGKEETKFGLDERELKTLIEKISTGEETFAFADLQGLMGMASFTENKEQVSVEFQSLEKFFKEFRVVLKPPFSTLSMGMSADYNLAIDAGSNMVRIGSLLFGERIMRK